MTTTNIPALPAVIGLTGAEVMPLVQAGTDKKVTLAQVAIFALVQAATPQAITLNNLTTTQRNAIVGPAPGAIIWNTTTTSIDIFTGTAWSGAAFLNALTDTWNNAGTTFQGISLNVSNGAGGAPVYNTGSYVLRFQNNGQNAFSIDPNGIVAIGTGSTGSLDMGFAPIRGVNGAVYFINSTAGDVVSGASNYIKSSNSSPLILGTSNTDRVSIASAGGLVTFISSAIATSAPNTQSGTTYTMAATDGSLIFLNAATVTVTLLSASANTGRWLYVKNLGAGTLVSASSNVAPIGSATAGTAILAAGPGKWATMQSDGTSWVIMAAN